MMYGEVDLDAMNLGRMYQVEVYAGHVNVTVQGRLLSKGVRFRNLRYWAFSSQAMVHLIDPDDIRDVHEVSLL